MIQFPCPVRLRARLGAPLLGLLALGACTTAPTGRYPSLLPRAIERRSDAEPVVPIVAARADPALDTRIAETLKALEASKTDFDIAATRAESAARLARGAAVGSDRWLDAQTALAELDIFRANGSGLVTDLEEVAVARAADGKPDYPALTGARDAAQAALDAQTARIGAIQASLPDA